MTDEELKYILDERAALKSENIHLKKTLIPNLERSIASIRGAHRVYIKKLESRKEQVKRLKEELHEQSEEKEKYKKMYLGLSQTYKQVTSEDCELIESLRDEIKQKKTVNKLIRLVAGEVHIFDGVNEPLILNCNNVDEIKKIEHSIYNNKIISYLCATRNAHKCWLSIKVEE